jgi:hypothetical protein
MHRPMHVIELPAHDWKSVLDFHDAIGRAQYEYDGRAVANIHSVDGLLELLVWDVCEAGQPPYAFRVTGTSNLFSNVRENIDLFQRLLLEARTESIRRRWL